MTAEQQLTKEEVKEKFDDRWWRLNNLYYIRDKLGKKVLFKPNPAQRYLYENMHHLNIILKARQLGFTTFIQIFMLDAAVFGPDIKCGVIAHNKDDAQAFFREKIKFPYENLPDGIKAANPPINDSTTELLLQNGSSVRVGTSMRSGTLQFLHVSEFGKLCAKYPDKAREVVTGSLNTVEAGCYIFIESTAEGQEGRFFDMCKIARTKALNGEKLTKMDYKFFFYPWFKDASYKLNPEGVKITAEDSEYFHKLKVQDGIELTDSQIAWYVKKKEIQGDDMMREYPATADEAFRQSVEGSYFAKQFLYIDQHKRICNVPHDPSLAVDTYWDLGMNDDTVIWFVQQHANEIRVINCFADSGEGLEYYVSVLQRYQAGGDEGENYMYGNHFAPHDINVRELGTGRSRLEIAHGLGLKFYVTVKLPKQDQITAARSIMQRCWFDETNTAPGVHSLRNYKKEWDERYGRFKDKPRHDQNSHYADGFLTLAVNVADHQPDYNSLPLHSVYDNIGNRLQETAEME